MVLLILDVHHSCSTTGRGIASAIVHAMKGRFQNHERALFLQFPSSALGSPSDSPLTLSSLDLLELPLLLLAGVVCRLSMTSSSLSDLRSGLVPSLTASTAADVRKC